MSAELHISRAATRAAAARRGTMPRTRQVEAVRRWRRIGGALGLLLSAAALRAPSRSSANPNPDPNPNPALTRVIAPTQTLSLSLTPTRTLTLTLTLNLTLTLSLLP